MIFLSGKSKCYFLHYLLTRKYFRDALGTQAWYQALSVIEYRGRVNLTGDSEGHYLCDVKNKETNLWFRTNDDSLPIPVNINDVSQNGYVVRPV